MALGGTAGAGQPPAACTCETCQQICPPKPGLPVASGPPATFAITRLYMGDVDRAGNAEPTAWQSFGVALSGVIFKDAKAESRAAHCKPQDAAKPVDVIVNAPNGVDNSFGKNVLPRILGVSGAGLDAKTQQGIALGAWSLLIDFPSFGPLDGFGGGDSSVLPVRGQMVPNVGLTAPTKWSTYPWRPLSTEISSAGMATASFPAGYLSDQRWTSSAHGLADDVVLPVIIYYGSYPLELRIRHAVVTARVSADGLSLTDGNIGGVLEPNALKTDLYRALGGLSGDPCYHWLDLNGPFDALLSNDILLDGTQDPNRTCDGISIGLGFEATRSARGTPVDPPVVSEPSCLCKLQASEPECMACCDQGDPGTWQHSLLAPPSTFFCDPKRCGAVCGTCQDESLLPNAACMHCVAQHPPAAPCGDLGTYCDCVSACPSLPSAGAAGSAGASG